MRLRLPALLVVPALLLTGCGGDEDPAATDTTSPAATTTAEETTTEATTDAPSPTSVATSEPATSEPTDDAAASGDLESLLLTQADLPSGWEEMDVASAEEDGPNAASNICGEATGTLDWTADAEDAAKVAFTAGQGTFLVQHVTEFGSMGPAEAALAQLAAAVGECDEWEADGVTFSVEPLQGVPPLGDSMTALRASADANGMSMTIDMVGWRHGGITDGVAYFSFGGEPDTEELSTILEAADAKFS